MLLLLVGCRRSTPATITHDPVVDATADAVARPKLLQLVHGKVIDLHSGTVERTLTETPPDREHTDARNERGFLVDQDGATHAFRLSDGAPLWTIPREKCNSFARFTEDHVVCVDTRSVIAFDHATGTPRTIHSSKEPLWHYEIERTTVAVVEKDHRVTLVNIGTGQATGSSKLPILSGATYYKLVPNDAGELCGIVVHHPEVIASCWDAKMKPVWEARGSNFNLHSHYEVTQTGPAHLVFSVYAYGGTKTGDPGTSVILSYRDRTFTSMGAFARRTIERTDGTLQYVLVHEDFMHPAPFPPPGTTAIQTPATTQFVTTAARVLLHQPGTLLALDRATGAEVFSTPLPKCAGSEHPIELHDDTVVVRCDGTDHSAKKRIGYAGVIGIADGRKLYMNEL